MTYGQMKSSVQVTLLRHGLRPTDTQLGIWVKDAHVAIDTILKWTRSSSSQNTTIGLAYYNVATGAHNIDTVTYDGDVMDEISLQDYLKYTESSSGNGTPEYWMRWGALVYLYPTPDAGATMVQWVVTAPTALSAASDTPTFPSEFHRAIVDYALMCGYADAGMAQESMSYRMLWEKAVAHTATYASAERKGPARVQARGA